MIRKSRIKPTEELIQKIRRFYPYAFPREYKKIFPELSVRQVRGIATVRNIRKLPHVVFFPKKFINDYEGGYVSGLIDGEGSFCVSQKVTKNGLIHYNPKFVMRLRVDDIEVLKWLRAYFECGGITVNRKKGGASPTATFHIGSIYNIMNSIFPHFEKYPLKAKKKRDFQIWRKIVILGAKHFREPINKSVSQEKGKLYQELRKARYIEDKALRPDEL